ncbi:MAG: hypothetical protein JNM84_08400 [Planctomycetes bacterium]|nr:hypothetical protein [Planctomycetota bacterium]
MALLSRLGLAGLRGWTKSRELRFFYARRPSTYVSESLSLDPAPADVQCFEPLPKERLARVDLPSSALTLDVDVRYPMGDETISLREDHGLLRLGGGEPLLVFPTASRLSVSFDPLNDRMHECSSSWRWLPAELEIDPAPGQNLEVNVAQRQGARVRLDLDQLRDPQTRLAGITINGSTPTWLYVDRCGQIRELASAVHRHGRVFSCELFEPGTVVLQHTLEPWRLEVELEPGMNDLRID